MRHVHKILIALAVLVVVGCDARVVSEAPARPYPTAVRVELSAQDVAYNSEGEEDKARSRSWRKTLTPDQRQRIEKAIVWETWSRGTRWRSSCCVPHHRLSYFDAAGKRLGEVDVCFCCACITSDLDPPEAQRTELAFKYDEMKAAITAIGIPTDIDCDE